MIYDRLCYNPFCNKNPFSDNLLQNGLGEHHYNSDRKLLLCNTNPNYDKKIQFAMKRENLSFSVELGKLYTVFYNYEIDLNITVFKALIVGVYFFQQNLSNGKS